MAYSRIKVWIAAEILSASDLNNEHNGHITNENDLDSRLISEISARSALETEHDVFYAACWNAGSSEIAANRVSNTSMKDNSVGFGELQAECDDPAAGTAGLRSLGTTAVKACAGNDSRLSNARTPTAHSHGFNTIENGTVMLPLFDLDSGTEYTETNSSYIVKVSNFRVYVPASAVSIRMAVRLKRAIAGAAYAKFTVGGNSSGEATTASLSYEWITTATLNVTALAGWYDMTIALKHAVGGTAYLQGYSFVWE